MKKRSLAKGLFFAISLCIMVCSTAGAATLTYSLTNLSAQQTGLWQIDYTISDFDSSAYDGFNIFYEYGLYEQISIVASADGWEESYASDPFELFGYPEDGLIDAYPSNPSGNLLTASFSVQLVYLGTEDTPGAPYFELYNSSDWETVPVPGTIILMLSGLAGLCATRRRL